MYQRAIYDVREVAAHLWLFQDADHEAVPGPLEHPLHLTRRGHEDYPDMGKSRIGSNGVQKIQALAWDTLHIDDQDLRPKVLNQGGSLISISGETENDRAFLEARDLIFQISVCRDKKDRCASSLEALEVGAVFAGALTELFGMADVTFQPRHKKAASGLNPVHYAVPA